MKSFTSTAARARDTNVHVRERFRWSVFLDFRAVMAAVFPPTETRLGSAREWPFRGMSTSSRRQGGTVVVGFESGPLLAIIQDRSTFGSGLYGALAVKRLSVSRGRNHVGDRLPPSPRGRVRRLSVACRPAPSFRDLAADYPAKHGIPLASGPRWRLRRSSVPAVEQGAGLVLRVRREVVRAAWHGAELAAVPSSSG